MRRCPSILIAVCVILLALTPLGPDPLAAPDPVLAQAPASQVPSFEPVRCWFIVPVDETEGETVTCGWVRVPENRANPTARTIKLAVAVLHATGSQPADTPLVYLEGGPGGSALASVDLWFTDPLRARRDLVLVDQRGTGYSTPSLNCPEYDDTETYPTDAGWLRACHARLSAAGIDLGAYNTVENAADIADVAAALGHARIDLLGISYGSRLALEVMQNHPALVRSAVLDSVYPPEAEMFLEDPVILARAFDRLFDACDADPTCQDAYPRLRQHYEATLRRLQNDPVHLDYTGVTLTAGEFILQMVDMLAFTDLVPQVPAAIEAAYQRDYIFMTDLINGYYAPPGTYSYAYLLSDTEYFAWLRDYLGEFETTDEFNDYLEQLSDEAYYDLLDEFEYAYDLMRALHLPSFEALVEYTAQLSPANMDALLNAFEGVDADSEGLYTSIHCTDEIPFYAAADIAALMDGPDPILGALANETVHRMRRDCVVWDVPPADSSEAERITSPIPALLLSGSLDPITPPEWTASAAAGLPNSIHLDVPGASHGVYDAGPCVITLIDNFLTDPGAPLDTSCLANHRPTFEVVTPTEP